MSPISAIISPAITIARTVANGSPPKPPFRARVMAPVAVARMIPNPALAAITSFTLSGVINRASRVRFSFSSTRLAAGTIEPANATA
jgi:hypothetical protein